MSLPRSIEPGRVYMVTRRVTQRQFLLRPSKEVNQAVRYCMAVAAEDSGVELHAVVAMSNHYHAILTDTQGQLPLFAQHFHSLLGRSLNHHHDRGENMWAGSEATSYLRLEDDQAVLAKVLYVLLNPVEAGLVKDYRHWPGELLVQPGSYLATKPKFFFLEEKEGGALPDRLKLRITAPPVPGPPERRIPLIYDMSMAFTRQIVAARRRAGLSFAGAKAVRRQSCTDAPRTPTPRGELSPRIATRNTWLRLEAIQRDRAFVDAHAACRKRWCAGERDVVWPVGTYQMRRDHHVPCADSLGP